MNHDELMKLLNKPETPEVEFKRQLHKIDDSNGIIKRREKDELIRDILALANGNASTAGNFTYLIIGVDNHLDDDGNRELFDVGERILTEAQILEIVNSACEPAIENVRCQIQVVYGKRLLVVTIPPSPLVYETTKRLNPSSAEAQFTEHVVFTRRNDGIFVASANERAAIQDLKRLRFHEKRNAPPVSFGAAIAAVIGGIAYYSTGDRYVFTHDGKPINLTLNKLLIGSVGAMITGVLGGILGEAYKEVSHMRWIWHRLPTQGRIGVFSAVPISVIVAWLANKLMSRK